MKVGWSSDPPLVALGTQVLGFLPVLVLRKLLHTLQSSFVQVLSWDQELPIERGSDVAVATVQLCAKVLTQHNNNRNGTVTTFHIYTALCNKLTSLFFGALF